MRAGTSRRLSTSNHVVKVGLTQSLTCSPSFEMSINLQVGLGFED